MSDYPILLIGGDGFLGSAFATKARLDGHEVHVLGRKQRADAPNYWSWGQHEALCSKVLGRQSILVDFAYASIPSTSYGDPVRDFSDNLGAVIRHLEFARAIDASHFVYVSSGGTVYGDANVLPISETASPQPISPYGITKLASENYALMVARLGLPVTILRPSNVYGPGQPARSGQGLVAAALSSALSGSSITIFGDGSQLRDYLYIDDFCDALCKLTKLKGESRIYNVGNGRAFSALEILAKVEGIVSEDGFSLKIEYAEPRPFDVNANALDIGRLKSATGWFPRISLEKGLRASWKWVRSQEQ
jgi:UDP-glucose 4-epimerase